MAAHAIISAYSENQVNVYATVIPTLEGTNTRVLLPCVDANCIPNNLEGPQLATPSPL